MSLTLLKASYTDSFEHAFDAKGRVTVPAEWRETAYESRLFIFPSSDKCVKIYPESWLGQLQEDIRQLKNNDLQRKRVEDLASMAQSTTWDQQGRIMIKEKLRFNAELKKEVILVGRLNHFQVWDKTIWEQKQASATTVEEALNAIGL